MVADVLDERQGGEEAVAMILSTTCGGQRRNTTSMSTMADVSGHFYSGVYLAEGRSSWASSDWRGMNMATTRARRLFGDFHLCLVFVGEKKSKGRERRQRGEKGKQLGLENRHLGTHLIGRKGVAEAVPSLR
jgi:hypothetical protein